VKANQWPVVYSSDYNIGFLGLERLHPFDSGKWGKVFQYLKGISRTCSILLAKTPLVVDLHLVDYHTMYSMICNKKENDTTYMHVRGHFFLLCQ